MSILLYNYSRIYKYSFLYGETRLRLVPPTRANICIYTSKLYNKANIVSIESSILFCIYIFH